MKYGLIGEKLTHSFSVSIHQKIGEYEYCLLELKREELKPFFEKRDFKGINVTIPYKTAVIPFLDEISPEAEKVGAVNTVINKGGKLIGYNTDVFGFSELIKKSGVEIKDKSVLIFGSGGTYKTAKYVCASLGAKSVKGVSREQKDGFLTYKTVDFKAQILVNTTPAGMFPDFLKLPLDFNGFKNAEGFIDAVYNPILTESALYFKDKGIKTACGLYMLVCQAVKSAELFGISPKSNAEKIYKEILNEKQNIVLVGMPGVGKTQVGKALAKRLDRPFYDTDLIISQKYSDIPEIIKEKGEEYFRKLETPAVEGLKSLNGAVIATGGGTVLDKNNVKLLKANGKICFIKRNLSDLSTKNRPLSSDLSALYESRKKYYEKAADFCIFNDDIPSSAEKIIKEFLK